MNPAKKNIARADLDLIEEALVLAILDSSESELREDLKAAGDDPDKRLSEINSLIADAKQNCAKRKFDQAKSSLAAWRAHNNKPIAFDRASLRARFEKIRAGDPELASKMLMAARNGKGLSDNDLNSLLEDLAKLDRLEGEDDGE
jgi:hypothetical protein